MHPSVEDWIRERLDAEGRYSPPGDDEENAADAPASGAASA